jgi:voltage-dependent potassium channel beta subunit
MEYRRLGKSGLQVSALSFGSWLTFGNQISEQQAEKLMHLAYDQGINFFDNAEQYAAGKSEIVMGNILSRTGWSRDSFVVSSKVFWGGDKPNQKGLSRKHVKEACHAALKRLQVDYLDLFFCHRPDIDTPVEETVRAMTELIWQGKILYWGTSEWSAQEIQEAYSCAREFGLIPPTMEQPQYNLFHRERFEKEYYKLYDGIGMGTTIWSPLASGLLTGKYIDGIAPEDSRAASHKDLGWLADRLVGAVAMQRNGKVKQLMTLADEIGTSVTRLSLAWCLKNKNVSTVILGSSKESQLLDNLGSIEVQALLTDEVMHKIEDIMHNKPVIPRF